MQWCSGSGAVVQCSGVVVRSGAVVQSCTAFAECPLNANAIDGSHRAVRAQDSHSSATSSHTVHFDFLRGEASSFFTTCATQTRARLVASAEMSLPLPEAPAGRAASPCRAPSALHACEAAPTAASTLRTVCKRRPRRVASRRTP